MNTNRQMHMIGNTTHAQTIALRPTHDGSQVSMQIGTNRLTQQRSTVLCAKDDMHQIERQ